MNRTPPPYSPVQSGMKMNTDLGVHYFNNNCRSGGEITKDASGLNSNGYVGEDVINQILFHILQKKFPNQQ